MEDSCQEKDQDISTSDIFIKDILKRENIELRHCPMANMIADFFTKSLQGKLFRKMRDVIMGLTNFIMEECVGTSRNFKIGGISKNVPNLLIAKSVLRLTQIQGSINRQTMKNVKRTVMYTTNQMNRLPQHQTR